MPKIKKVSLYSVQLTELEMNSLRDMLQYYEDFSDEDSPTHLAVRQSFGIKPSGEPKIPARKIEEPNNTNIPDEGETLPERALRVASGKSRGPKGRITRNE
ncbi:MAG: hypothetical protein K6T83_03590 [Alicyclobacillus sp.]|nr:hypothetical protein [Alicyclobacillus sp.]